MKPTRKHRQDALFFDALGHARRQMLCQILQQHAPRGLSFGMLQSKSGLSASTLAHHLQFMDRGRILRRKTVGRETWLSLQLPQDTPLPIPA